MRPTVYVLGIGAGHPDDITVRAVSALNTCSAVLVPTKTDVPTGDLRAQALARHVADDATVEFISIMMPSVRDRDQSLPYEQSILEVRERQGAIYSLTLETLLADGHERIALVSWGDPMVFNGMTSLISQAGEYAGFDVVVLPAVSSIQTIASMSCQPIASLGKGALLISGRDLPEHIGPDIAHMTVMLTVEEALVHPDLQGWHIAWGANLGGVGEQMITGIVRECADAIRAGRDQVKAEAGWVFEIANLARTIL